MMLRSLLPLLLSLLLTISVSAQTRTRESQLIQARASRLEPYILESSRRYGVDARILRTVCLIESRFQVDAVSPKGARGPMQFMPETARRYGLSNPHDPQGAIDAAARYLRDLLRRFGGRIDLALAAYNSGEGTVESFSTGRPLMLANGKVINPRGRRTGGIPPYAETMRYVRSGMSLIFDRPMITPKLRPGGRLNLNGARVPGTDNFTLDVTDSEILKSAAEKIEARSVFIDVP